jgi:hypothetical protein
MNAMKDRIIDDLNGVPRDRYGRNIEVPVINGDRPLTWPEVEGLTGGATGTFNTPCAYCGPHNSSSIRFQIKRPTLTSVDWHCFYCGVSGSLRKKGRASPEAEAKARRLAEEREQDRRAVNSGLGLRIWDESLPIAGTLAQDYLRARGVFDLPPNAHDVLRYHPRCPFEKTTAPCMIALLRDVITDERVAIHRTWVTREGKALGRMALGPLARAAVKLWPLEADRLTVGEGIETVLAAVTREDIIRSSEPLRPAWALTVANNLKFLPVIDGVRQLRILVDNDVSGVGQRAAANCAISWSRRGRRVVRLTPKLAGADFNDVVREGANR